MILILIGILLFVNVERVIFIKIPAPTASDRLGMSWEADRSRHPE